MCQKPHKELDPRITPWYNPPMPVIPGNAHTDEDPLDHPLLRRSLPTMNSEIRKPPFANGQRLRIHVKNVISGHGETLPVGSTCTVTQPGGLSSIVVFDDLPLTPITISNDLLTADDPPATASPGIPVEGRPLGASAEYPLGLGIWKEPHHLVCDTCGSHFLHAELSTDRCGLCRSFPELPPIGHRVISFGVSTAIPGLEIALHGQTLLDVHHPEGSSVDVRPGLILRLTLGNGIKLVVEPLIHGRTWLHPIAIHRSAVAPITRIWLTHI